MMLVTCSLNYWRKDCWIVMWVTNQPMLILQQNLVVGVTAGLDLQTLACTVKCTLIPTLKKTHRVSATFFWWKRFSSGWTLSFCCFIYCILFCVFLLVSSAGSSTGRRRKQRTIPTNDELLYDPDEDDRDQAWVDARRRRSETPGGEGGGVKYNFFSPLTSWLTKLTEVLLFLCSYNSKRRGATSSQQQQAHQSQALPSSDAVLNCPACMTTLCLDCQRWELHLPPRWNTIQY